jgi:hypothetical protein
MDYNRELLCKDCRHSHRPWTNRILFVKIYHCRHPENLDNAEFNPVTGEMEGGGYSSCRSARLSSGICGPSARHWTPKNSRQHLFTVLKQNYDRTT